MSLDHPIGDPTGGAAYGEKNDPVSAIISIATMAGTGGAVLAGTATLFQGLAFAGAALSLTGNVTGNKTLSKLGMVAGIAGGVGMLGESVFGMSSPSMGETFGYGANANAGAVAPSAFDAANPNAPSAPEAAVAPGEVVAPASTTVGGESLASQIAADPSAVTGSQALNAPQGLVSGNAPTLTPANAVNELAASQAYNPADATRAVDFGYKPGGTSVMESFKAGNYGQALGQAGSNVMDLAKSNPGAAMVMGQAAGGVANWLSGKTDAEIEALQAQTGFSNAKAMEVQELLAREKRRRANLNAGYTQVNAGMQVNPTAKVQQAWTQQPGIPQSAGLIAGARG
jgi:hypothetical protein